MINCVILLGGSASLDEMSEPEGHGSQREQAIGPWCLNARIPRCWPNHWTRGCCGRSIPSELLTTVRTPALVRPHATDTPGRRHTASRMTAVAVCGDTPTGLGLSMWDLSRPTLGAARPRLNGRSSTRLGSVAWMPDGHATHQETTLSTTFPHRSPIDGSSRQMRCN